MAKRKSTKSRKSNQRGFISLPSVLRKKKPARNKSGKFKSKSFKFFGKQIPKLRVYTLAALLVFAGIGAYLTFFSKAATVTLATIEAEAMSGIAGSYDPNASGYSGVAFYSNATISTTTSFSQTSATQLTIRAKGDQCQGSPNMEIKVNGNIVKNVSISSLAWTDYGVPVNLPVGSYNISVGFTNDLFYSGGTGKKRRASCDRNLYVDKLTLYGTIADPISSPSTSNLAYNKSTATSSIEGPGYEPSKAVDGSGTTRWASAMGFDPQWIQIDLGAATSINRIKLNWDPAYARSYQIQVSADAVSWTSIYSTTNGDGGTDDLTGLSGNGRYVRMLGTVRGSPWGYSLWEMEVYGSGNTTTEATPPPPTTPPPTSTTCTFNGDASASTLSDASAAACVQATSENRPSNVTPNNRVPTSSEISAFRSAGGTGSSPPQSYKDKVTGNYKGSTDDIIEWAAYKWGVRPDVVKAVAVIETGWNQTHVGDGGYSYGLMQIKRPTGEAWTGWNGTHPLSEISSAFNVDYYGAVIRACYDGYWGHTGDVWGCIGSWYSGGWYDQGAQNYIASARDHLARKSWEQPGF